MTDADADNRWLTRDRAKLIVLGLLVATLGLGYYERREVPATDIPLGELPDGPGSWEMIDEEINVVSDGSYKLLQRLYRNADGVEAEVRVQATYTRLGSLRDWSLAATAQGWTAVEDSVWHGADGRMQARVERLVNEGRTRIALTWYTSGRSQTPSLQRAEMLGWRDRLVGDRRPWASLYILARVEPDQQTEQAVKKLAALIGPSLGEIMAESRPGGRDAGPEG